MSTIAPTQMIGFLLCLRAEIHGLEMELHEASGAKLVAAMGKGELDVALMAMPALPDSLYAMPLYPEREDWVQAMIVAGLGRSIMPEHLPMLDGIGTRPLKEPKISRTVAMVTVAGWRWLSRWARSAKNALSCYRSQLFGIELLRYDVSRHAVLGVSVSECPCLTNQSN